MTPTKIKAFIETYCKDYIGTYELEGKSTVTFPAVTIGEPPNGLTVKGNEVIIGKFPRISKNQRTGNYTYRCEYHTVEVFLHDYEDDEGWENFYTLVDELLATFPRASGRDIPQSKHFESLPGYQVIIKVESFREVNDTKQSQLAFGGGKHVNSVSVY